MTKRARILVAAAIGLVLGAAVGWLVGWLARSDNAPFFVALGASGGDCGRPGLGQGAATAPARGHRAVGAGAARGRVHAAAHADPGPRPAADRYRITCAAGRWPDRRSGSRRYPACGKRTTIHCTRCGIRSSDRVAAVRRHHRRVSRRETTRGGVQLRECRSHFACYLFAALGERRGPDLQPQLRLALQPRPAALHRPARDGRLRLGLDGGSRLFRLR